MPYVSGMRFYEIVLIAVGLAMDAFAVSVCKGLKMSKVDYKYTFIIALFFWSISSCNAYYRLVCRKTV